MEMAARMRVMSGVCLCGLLGLWLWPTAGRAATCPNEAVRSGASSSLPDCRAYELVTPPDTNGRILSTIFAFEYNRPRDFFPSELASPEGDSFIYETHAGALTSPFGGGGVFDAYEAERDQECASYLRERAQYYGAEQRWQESPFWRQRSEYPQMLDHAT